MNSLEAEYSFLAPTWKLPTVATTSMYAPTYNATYLPNAPELGPEWSLWNNPTYNSRYVPSYIPSTATRPNYPTGTNYQSLGVRPAHSGPPYYQQSNNPNSNDSRNLTTNFHPNNEYEPDTNNNNMSNYGPPQQRPMGNRGLTYATQNQNNPPPPPLSDQKRRVKIIDHNRHTPSTTTNDYAAGRQSHNSVHEPPLSQQNHTSELNRSTQKSKPSTSNHHVDDRRHASRNGNHLSIHDYLYGADEPDSGSYAESYRQHQRRLQEEKQGRKSVASEYRAFAQNGGFGPSFGSRDYQAYGDKVISEKKKKTYSRAVRDSNLHKLEEQKRSPNTGQQKNRPVPVPVPKNQRAREYAEKIEKPQHLKPLSETESSILITSLSNHPHRSSIDSVRSLKLQRRVRFRSRDFIRRRSSTVLDLPSHIIGKGIPNRPIHNQSSSKLRIKQGKSSTRSTKNFIIPPNMITTKNLRLPPTAIVVINPILTARTYSKKPTKNRELFPAQRRLTTRSISIPHRKSTGIFKDDFHLKIQSFHPNDNKSSNE